MISFWLLGGGKMKKKLLFVMTLILVSSLFLHHVYAEGVDPGGMYQLSK